MLALVVLVALGQCTKDTDCKGERICAVGQCVAPELAPRPASRPSRPEVKALDAQRPALYWPISSLALGAVLFVVGAFVGASNADVGLLAGGLGLGGGFTIAGAVSLFTTIWARSRVGELMDALEK